MKLAVNKLVLLTFLFVLAPAGCKQTSKVSSVPPPKDVPPPKLITTGSCLELKDSPADKGLADELAYKVADLLRQNKIFSATQLVERFPDRAAVLCSRPQGSPHAPGEDRHHAEREDCIRFIQQVHQKQLSGADVYTAVPKLLAQGEKHRLKKHEAAWVTSWEKAVLIAATAPVPDPNLWENISSFQPTKRPWPESLAGTFQNYWNRRGFSHVAATPATVPDLVWFSIGQWHMDRGEAKAALTAFQRAVNLESPPLWKDMAVLYQARALMQLRQGPAAITLLTGLATQSDSPWRRPALAVIAACKFQGGHFQQAEALYNKALEKGPSGQVEDFAGKSEAESDLGLTLLALGDEAKGLAQLHVSRENFARIGRIDAVLQDLENEIRYFEATHREESARPLREEFDAWQRRASS